uniref:Uncharacterized protein n=1 Tax=Brassica oleracea var. oleracea TaxID=109376 RepID=A0A0D3CU96_BRAOL
MVKEGGELMGIDMVMVHEKEVLTLLNIEGCVTVWRDYHGDVFAAQAERFFSKLIEKEVFVFRFPRWSSEKVVQYALLDEMTDFGYPQYMEARILKEFIKTDAYRMEVTQRPHMAVTSSLLKERRDTVQ